MRRMTRRMTSRRVERRLEKRKKIGLLQYCFFKALISHSMVAGGSSLTCSSACWAVVDTQQIMLCDPGRGSCNSIVLPCVVWVKRRDSVRHSTRPQPCLHGNERGEEGGRGRERCIAE